MFQSHPKNYTSVKTTLFEATLCEDLLQYYHLFVQLQWVLAYCGFAQCVSNRTIQVLYIHYAIFVTFDMDSSRYLHCPILEKKFWILNIQGLTALNSKIRLLGTCIFAKKSQLIMQDRQGLPLTNNTASNCKENKPTVYYQQ